MINRIANSVYSRYLWILVTVYVFNFSVDTAITAPQQITGEPAYNSQESFVEIVVEQVLGYEDAFDEIEDHDTEDQNNCKPVKKDLKLHYSLITPGENVNLAADNLNYPGYVSGLPNTPNRTNTPPPEQVC